MNAISKKSAVLFLAVAAMCIAGNAGFAQQTLSVTPSVTSNTYTGLITLAITGLTNGEKVVIQKYLDLNANGTIDPGEPLVDAFKISDGGVTVIGGVTNINVPFDINPAAGAITTTLSFPATMPLETVVGQQIIQLVSPTGRFSPVTATFTVTNAALSQSVTGTIYSNGVPLANAVVVAQDQVHNNTIGAAVADNTGHYLLRLSPGSYSLIAGMPNYYFDQSQAPSVVLTNGLPATNSLFLTNGTVVISGSVYDAANSNGLGGALLTLDSGNFFAISFTDSNGNYSAAVAPSFWKIKPAKERLTRRAYLQPDSTPQVDASTGAVANVGIALPKGTALFYGRLTDNSNTPFANVQFDASAGNNLDAKGYSDANGNYAVAVLGDQTNYWSCNANSGLNTSQGSYIANFFCCTTLSSNQAMQVNFVALPAIGRIYGRVLDNSGNPVSGVTLMDDANIGGNEYQSQESTTDNSGNYSLAVAAGQWNIQFLTGGYQDNLDTKGYVDLTAPHIVNVPPTNVVLNLTVYPIGTPLISQPQRFSSTQFGFNINGVTNVTYTVQAATNITSTNWTSLFSFQMTTNPFPVVDINATNSARYYRVRKD